jgi:hypothetical protein
MERKMASRERKLFEKWITSPPFEREIIRYDADAAWAGQYKRINVALAWEAFMEGLRMSELKRYIVCGGRDFNDWEFMQSKLEVLLKIDWNFVLVHGDCRGADRLAASWGDHRAVIVEPHPADWDLYGKAAGGIRNQEMLEGKIDGVIAFKGNSGTADMVKRAILHDVPVWDLREGE